jgi:hypothetical protein
VLRLVKCDRGVRTLELRERAAPSAFPVAPVIVGTVLATVASTLATMAPMLTLTGAAAFALAVAVWLRPPFAAYVLLAATPLVAGIDRGVALPLLRPSEALVLLVGGVVLARYATEVLHRRSTRLDVTSVDAALLLFCTAGSVVPLLAMAARNREIGQDDVLFALLVWKAYVVFLIVRWSVRTEPEVRTCLWVSMAAATAVGAIAILQAIEVPGIVGLLSTLYTPEGEEVALEFNRGTSTVGSSFAVAHLMVFNLAIAGGFLARRASKHRVILALASIGFVISTFASGQFSAAVALSVGVVALGLITGYFARLVALLTPCVAVAFFALRPVIERRLAGFDTAAGIPPSWIGRWDNLTTFFWPKLFSDFNVILGVRPAARVPIPVWMKEQGIPGTYVWIESGHTWLLWTGGIPFLVAFLVFVWIAVRTVARIARQRADAIGVAAVASFTALAALTVLMTFDSVLTMRGSAEVNFALLALACTAADRADAPARP